jgi:hypothetical protein
LISAEGAPSFAVTSSSSVTTRAELSTVSHDGTSGAGALSDAVGAAGAESAG